MFYFCQFATSGLCINKDNPRKMVQDKKAAILQPLENDFSCFEVLSLVGFVFIFLLVWKNSTAVGLEEEN